MPSVHIADLPLVNACINTVVACLLLAGWVLIRKKHRNAHRLTMLSALVLSALFLASYVTYHLNHGSTKFAGQGIVRPIYFTILISHTVLAVVNLPFIVVTVLRAFRGEFASHARVAKRTWAIWMYVAVTGPIVYVMLYRMYAPEPSTSASGSAEEVFASAQTAHHAGRDEEALTLYRRAAALGSLPSRCYAAVLDERLHEAISATVAIDRALLERADEPHCRTLRARARVYDNETQPAIATLEDVVKTSPDVAFFWASLGFARFRALEYQAAAEAFERSVALDPGLAVNVYNAGYARFLGGEYSKAKPLMERALALGIDPELTVRAQEDLAVIAGSLWVCPMHSDITGKPGDTCSRCGMKLAVAPHGLEE